MDVQVGKVKRLRIRRSFRPERDTMNSRHCAIGIDVRLLTFGFLIAF
jgi:hypothetical protein